MLAYFITQLREASGITRKGAGLEGPAILNIPTLRSCCRV